ncbi:hypothetical protein SAMD00019534_113740 [Acytostelium subglobosum LB1]|uniref:hypothetical protein n=1 Tax=Acytostelium subglobosum LB1 TaxID=1410327 RepID=UPI0006448549|nr:hypothetical protein SAMD00019534_113740 [Acytostelium subglobosum LB1]GAM28198.1 hypothetical protein SAMD00019534_113740 [Acytostelium subglobosum LB1]|eukprot:XP_012748832.1 hypothetical protein SAMD00019534_113740 [Acytostelium subglobosum LB1]
MFTAYLNVNGAARSLSILSYHLGSAIDTGNVDFVRLLLKHKCGGETARDGVKRPASVDMLKFLHEEFEVHFNDHVLLPSLLKLCIKWNKVDSVQYIVKHMPKFLAKRESPIKQSIRKGLVYVAKQGNVEMFQSLCNTPLGLKPFHNLPMLQAALDFGHGDLIKPLLCGSDGDDDDDGLRETVIQYFEWPDGDTDRSPTDAKLRVTPLSTINTNNFEMAESLLPQVEPVSIGVAMWGRMSSQMAKFITHPRHKGLKLFSHSNLSFLLESMKVPGCHITEEIILNFIDNCPSDAPRCSNTKHLISLSIDCLVIALETGNIEAMSLVLDHTSADHLDRMSTNHTVEFAAREIISKESLDKVALLLDRLPKLVYNDYIRESIMTNFTPGVVPHFLDKFTITDYNTNGRINANVMGMIATAFYNDNQYALDILVQRLKDAGQPLPTVTLRTLMKASHNNAYHMLEHYLKSTEFNNHSKTNQLRTLNMIMHRALMSGRSRIIKLCQHSIKVIQENRKRDRDDYGDKDHCGDIDQIMVVHASSHLETAVHKVFTDNKLCQTIMYQPGLDPSQQVHTRHIVGRSKNGNQSQH